MNRVFRVSTAVAMAGALASACTEDIGLEDVEPSEPGAIQPDASGVAIGEAEACQRIRDALSAAATRLDCPQPELECPDLLRAAGSQACVEYDEGTVAGCEEVIGRYEGACTVFEQQPCLVAALPGTMSSGCVPPVSVPDAGADSGTTPDAAPVDAGRDTSTPDTGSDASGGQDAGSDAAADDAGDGAVGDGAVGDGAAGDAASDAATD